MSQICINVFTNLHEHCQHLFQVLSQGMNVIINLHGDSIIHTNVVTNLHGYLNHLHGWYQ